MNVHRTSRSHSTHQPSGATLPAAVRRALHPGFTLVELFIVIGIIALLIAILIPLITKLQQRSRAITCQTNMRQVLYAMRGYVEENRGSFPYGFHWTRTRVPFGSKLSDWDPAPDNGSEFVSWASQLGKWLNRGKMRGEENDATNYPLVFQCPEAMEVRPHFLSYAMNMVVAVDPRAELKLASPPRAQLRPLTTVQMRPDTVLLWDTAVFINSRKDIDYLLGLDIDGQRFWRGAATPQFRYYNVNDPFGHIPPGTFGQNNPINLSVGDAVYKNIDPIDPSQGAPYQGNLRFRHLGGTSCTVGFADGHVGEFTAKINSDKTVKSHNALRKNFMTRWPSGVSPDPSYPY